MQRLDVGGWLLTDAEALDVVRCVVAGLRQRGDNAAAREFAGRVLSRVNGRADSADNHPPLSPVGRGHALDPSPDLAGSWVSTAEAAGEHKVSVRTVRRLAAGAKVEARRDPVNGSWSVSAAGMALWAAGRSEGR